ncbi:MAG: hypothetical protein CME66_00960 [Halobacteriovoraceae bacterium]|nr:hypothetical protein [Halobacteriovoraceae bacterium]
MLHIENRFGVFTKAKLKKVKEGNFDTVGSESNKKVLVPKSNSIEDILENLTQSGVKRYVGRKISLNVNNINYQEVLKMIGDTSGFNIIIEDEVKQLPPLTISLTNLPWDQVLDTVMNLGDLVATKFGNILTVTTAAKARQEKNMELNNQNKTKILEPLVTKIVPISYSKLEEISAILQAYSTPERGSIQSDKRTQNLIIKDTVDVVERMRKIIQTLDTQTPQILIEAKIVEATEDYELRAGLTEGLKLNYDPLGSASNLPADNGVFSLSTAPNKSAPGVLGASIGVARLTNLAFNLELMESESKGKIISAPKIITENNKAATISDTRERFFPLTSINPDSGLEVTATQTLEATINLTVTPKVTNEGAIAMDVNITKEGFGIPDAGELPPTTSRNVKTSVLVENGSTVVIGGIYLTEDKTVESGVPFLKDLPLIGWLFRSVYNPTKTRNELVIFLTPRIVNQEAAGLVNRDADNGVNI